MTEPILRVEHLVKHFREGRHTIHAVNDVSFEVYPGEAVAVVGESGSGKSTMARCIIRLERPTAGRIVFNGEDITHHSARQMRPARRMLQMVFQDTHESLNPLFSVRRILREPLILHDLNHDKTQILETLEKVKLDHNHLGRRPHQLSGGQKQRVGMARAMITRPHFVVLDEPTASLDMSLRLQTLNLLRELQRELNMAYLFISHDLSTVRHLCDRVLVMYLGRIVEAGRVEDVFDHPRHVYTQALLSAIPIPDPTIQRQRLLLSGETPSTRQLKPGCGLQDRCPHVSAECRVPIPFYKVSDGHVAACRLAKPPIIEEKL